MDTLVLVVYPHLPFQIINKYANITNGLNLFDSFPPSFQTISRIQILWQTAYGNKPEFIEPVDHFSTFLVNPTEDMILRGA